MSTFAKPTFALLAGAFLLMSCSQKTGTATEARPAGERLTTAEAIQIAQRAAEKDGRRLSDYKQPEAHYEFTRKDKSWFVFFDGRVPMPGNHFSVSIDDPTGKAEVHGGL